MECNQVAQGIPFFLLGTLGLAALAIAIAIVLIFSPVILPFFLALFPFLFGIYVVIIAVIAVWMAVYAIMGFGAGMYYFFFKKMKISTEHKGYTMSGTKEAGLRQKGLSTSKTKKRKKKS
ncbi:MAG: hypothetical protein KKB03_00285 [Nanoarchaeota archaeon]|nr:hypothetical protein [Nanoarchaeota archaeon]MBU1135846.1 hypothetical protein [Nanoarchaeota archaeon]MBU2519666.1 hypothetical protein [Nanoarchaeota archaeon]